MSQDNWRSTTRNAVTEKQLSNKSYDKNAEDLFPLVIPSFLAKTIDFKNDLDPILQQVMPTSNEFIQHKSYSNDPVGDLKASAVPGVIHKYHGRVLLISTGICAVNCRYCFRRNFDYAQNYASKNNWQKAIQYLTNNKDVNEVILSGGDPLMLSSKVLKHFSQQLSQIKHIKTLRIHTRIPVVSPSRINKNFINWLNDLPFKKVMVLHINHPNELQDELKEIFQSIAQTKTVLFNQSVLLKGINDKPKTLAQLSHKLFDYGVLPYYLNQLDKAKGTIHFRVKNKTAKSIHNKLLQLLPGYLVPKLVEEISGKMNKSPLF
ncbi:MAG: EF-P beta-lysylation protein EpmB [Marinicellaceae bacterium]